MEIQSYRSAFQKSGITLVENWCRKIGIAEDTHKSISSGRLAVSPEVESRIKLHLENAEAAAKELGAAITAALLPLDPAAAFTVNEANLDITFALSGGDVLIAKNHGVDSLNGWSVYNMNCGPRRGNALFLYARTESWHTKESPQNFTWYLWRGPFTSAQQNQSNFVTTQLIRECLGVTRQ